MASRHETGAVFLGRNVQKLPSFSSIHLVVSDLVVALSQRTRSLLHTMGNRTGSFQQLSEHNRCLGPPPLGETGPPLLGCCIFWGAKPLSGGGPEGIRVLGGGGRQ